MDFTDEQIDRYARHLVLPEIGEEGQEALLRAKVLVIGAGGLGSPLLLYLAAAGVGTLGVVDDDTVDLSNLQRQVLHNTSSIGTEKVESARQRLAEVNPEIKVAMHPGRIVPGNAMEILSDYDVVADGSDNFTTRYLINDACYLARKPLVSAAIMRFEGQISTYKAFRRDASDPNSHPCYRCLFGDQPEDYRGSCADVGVLGMLPGVMGSLQATEVVKELLGIGRGLSGRLILYDALDATFREISVKSDPACPLCGAKATIKDVTQTDYGATSPVCAA